MAEKVMAENVAESTVKEKKEKKEKTVKIKLPRERKDQEDLFVSVNERTFQIKRGVEVDVPECVAEVIRNAERMQEEAYDFDTSVQK